MVERLTHGKLSSDLNMHARGAVGTLSRAWSQAGTYLVVVFHVFQMALLTDEQVQVLLPLCVHGLHVCLPGRGETRRCSPGAWAGRRGTERKPCGEGRERKAPSLRGGTRTSMEFRPGCSAVSSWSPSVCSLLILSSLASRFRLMKFCQEAGGVST